MGAVTALGRPRSALVAVLVLSAAVGVGLVADMATRGSTGTSGGATALPVRVATSGPVQITVAPVRVDASGAVFRLVLDNHEIELDTDIAAGASFAVGGRTWAPATWSGDGPGGHHREGRLAFPNGGPTAGEAVLTLAGFPGPVELQWTLREGGARS